MMTEQELIDLLNVAPDDFVTLGAEEAHKVRALILDRQRLLRRTDPADRKEIDERHHVQGARW